MTKEANLLGIYRVKLCKNGEWQTITVDDYFPCYAKSGPLFSSSRDNSGIHSLWVQILEKSYAKLHGAYMLLRGGSLEEAFWDLTGCPTESFSTKNAWNRIILALTEGDIIMAVTEGEERWETSKAELEDGLFYHVS